MKKAPKRAVGSPRKKKNHHRGKRMSKNSTIQRTSPSPLMYAFRKSEMNGIKTSELFLPPTKSGRYEIVHVLHKQGESVEIVSHRTALFASIPLAKLVLPNDVTWMELLFEGNRIRSTHPCEIFFQQYAMEKAHGDVLVCGLGMGVMLHELEQNKNVHTVTCVEQESELINLLSPYFPNVIIINDAVEKYLADEKNKGKYDFLYFDSDGDSEGVFYSSVAPLRMAAKNFLKPSSNHADIVCWGEEVMRGQIIHSTMQKIHDGFDLMKISGEEIAHRQRYQKVDMDFFARYGKLEPSKATTSLVEKFVNNWEMESSEK